MRKTAQEEEKMTGRDYNRKKEVKQEKGGKRVRKKEREWTREK